jgi:hypothetical protein
VAETKDQLFAFLNWAGDKGMMKKSSARALRSACNAVLAVLDDSEAQDVLAIDLLSVVHRYENVHGLEISPSTMRAYKQRVTYALEEFKRYNQDKAGWKPSGSQYLNSSTQRSSKGRNEGRRPREGSHITEHTQIQIDGASQITHHFPMRIDTVVTISGIPFDVKRGEMSRLNAFLSNLVSDLELNDRFPPMLNPSNELSKDQSHAP